MKHKKHFKKILSQRFPKNYSALLQGTENAYLTISKDTRFAKTSTNPLDKRLDLMAYFLSTIQTLEANQVDFHIIKEVCTDIAKEYVRPKTKFQAWLKKLPPKLIKFPLITIFLKMMDNKVSKKGHKDGFRAKIVTNKEETYGFGYGIDIIECGICKLFHKHNMDRYTPILCEVDKITSSLAGLELFRQGTIANGAEICDFRFKKK
ncbi:L-2-amino-thiazoline-4-carboxylic acid hydrolase [Flagellimonas lutimaris]|uniref:L-2-amino-thiazoline-4-carboxylic acid hydrolase n=1 Tax=Flagellimonas lutimaris TaxID=475082 RepID=UPI003F5CBFAD